jgi:FlaA1/EpsC-like NDP-sugar epimerase
VYHAAAYKHVPLVEHNPAQAILNNVWGTLICAQCALEVGTQKFVLISTDKAVRPTNLMGASKRLAEMVLQALDDPSSHLREPAEGGRGTAPIFTMVRFGNVLNSSGSVVPLFRSQITEGGPVTVTHPEVTRYFMTIPEAAQLVMQAGLMGSGGEIFVLDMGEPVKIVDLARDLLRLSGLEEGQDIDITFTGLRPGEKLYEEVLFGDEDVRQTQHPKVIRVLASEPPESVETEIDDLVRLATLSPSDEARIRQAIIRLVPDFILPALTKDVLPLRTPPRKSNSQ